MIIQATPYGTKKEEPFAFTYSGDFTDERVDGVGDVTLNTSGTLVTSGKTVTVSVYILAGGGGAGGGHQQGNSYTKGSGGGGGNQTVEVILEAGEPYLITVGAGGAASSDGGDTSAFGYTSTGGKAAYSMQSTTYAGAGGSPNGGRGKVGSGGNSMFMVNAEGGFPNGGAVSNGQSLAGGNGLVRITFS